MTRTMFAAILALVCLFGCGNEAASSGDRPDAATKEPDARTQPEELKNLFLGTWDYEMRYPSGDEVANVRVLREDGTGSQWNREAGDASRSDFRWDVTDDGKTLELRFGGAMTSVYGIVRASAGELVLKNAHGLDETCTRR